MTNNLRRLFIILICCASFALGDLSVHGQNSVFTYQGKLTDNNAAPTATYTMRFELFGAASGGTAIGTPFEIAAVPVTNGIFTVNLDFDASSFDGSARYLQISIYSAAASDFVTLTPRQRVTSAPYAIQSFNAANATNAAFLGGFAAELYAMKTDARFTDQRSPLAGSANYIQNQNAGTQTAASFNISGSGTLGGTLSANAVNATQQFNLNNSRILSAAGTANLFGGLQAGQSNTSGNNNTFFGSSAGQSNVTASRNSFFGASAGKVSTGNANSFFGALAGTANTTGFGNSFFGGEAGKANTTGGNNSFFGSESGAATTTGGGNAFFGSFAGQKSTASNNAFFGASAGSDNTTGAQNSFFGGQVGGSNTTGGGNAFFGYSAGSLNTTATNNSFFGAGAGDETTTGGFNSFLGNRAGTDNTIGEGNTFVGYLAGTNNTTGDNNTAVGSNSGFGSPNLIYATAVGAGAVASSSNTVVIGRAADDVRVPGNLIVSTLGSAGSTSLCRNNLNQISTCTAGNFAENNREALAALEAQNERLQKQLQQQQSVIEELRKLVCQTNRQAAVCAEERKEK